MPEGDCVITESAEIKIARIEVMVQETHTRLFGGEGQKGVIQAHDEDIDSLKTWKNRTVGAVSVIMFVLGTIGARLLGWI